MRILGELRLRHHDFAVIEARSDSFIPILAPTAFHACRDEKRILPSVRRISPDDENVATGVVIQSGARKNIAAAPLRSSAHSDGVGAGVRLGQAEASTARRSPGREGSSSGSSLPWRGWVITGSLERIAER